MSRPGEFTKELVLNPKMRRCLRCGKKWKSPWEGRRICPKCTTLNEQIFLPEIHKKPVKVKSVEGKGNS